MSSFLEVKDLSFSWGQNKVLKNVNLSIKPNQLVSILGVNGVGKTTFINFMSERQGWRPFYESVSDNPYLNDFYGDMKRWSFHLQIYFLHKRFESHLQMTRSNGGVIQDRTIYEDVEIFARNLHDMGNLSNRDWDNYLGLFKTMTSFLNKFLFFGCGSHSLWGAL